MVRNLGRQQELICVVHTLDKKLTFVGNQGSIAILVNNLRWRIEHQIIFDKPWAWLVDLLIIHEFSILLNIIES